MTNLLADESVDFRIVKALRSNGYQIETILEISPGISDDQVLKIANEKSAVIITSDKDFGELTFRQKKSNFGIILLRFPNEVIEEQMEVTQLAFEKFGVELPYKFTVVTSKKIRIRKLFD